MAWSVEFHPAARDELAALDRPVQRRIQRFIDERLVPADDPRKLGRVLTGAWAGFWKYRVGDWRMIAQVRDERLIIYIVRVGHRREVYR
ncbi:MAG: type II toxin-antitoxin system RelE family toxin [Terriglobales bacterium]